MNREVMEQILQKIKEYHRIMIFRHVRPDGDCVGASKGLKAILKLSFPEKEVLLIDKEMAKCGYLTVDKGSVTVNGVSLTVCNPTDDSFQVAIIPYTYEHTNFHTIAVGTKVNIEFDIIGKYIARIAKR